MTKNDSIDNLFDNDMQDAEHTPRCTAKLVGEALLIAYDLLEGVEQYVWDLQNSAQGAYYNARGIIVDLYEEVMEYVAELIGQLTDGAPSQRATELVDKSLELANKAKNGFKLARGILSFAKGYIEGVLEDYDAHEFHDRDSLDV